MRREVRERALGAGQVLFEADQDRRRADRRRPHDDQRDRRVAVPHHRDAVDVVLGLLPPLSAELLGDDAPERALRQEPAEVLDRDAVVPLDVPRIGTAVVRDVAPPRAVGRDRLVVEPAEQRVGLEQFGRPAEAARAAGLRDEVARLERVVAPEELAVVGRRPRRDVRAAFGDAVPQDEPAELHEFRHVAETAHQPRGLRRDAGRRAVERRFEQRVGSAAAARRPRGDEQRLEPAGEQREPSEVARDGLGRRGVERVERAVQVRPRGAHAVEPRAPVRRIRRLRRERHGTQVEPDADVARLPRPAAHELQLTAAVAPRRRAPVVREPPERRRVAEEPAHRVLFRVRRPAERLAREIEDAARARAEQVGRERRGRLSVDRRAAERVERGARDGDPREHRLHRAELRDPVAAAHVAEEPGELHAALRVVERAFGRVVGHAARDRQRVARRERADVGLDVDAAEHGARFGAVQDEPRRPRADEPERGRRFDGDARVGRAEDGETARDGNDEQRRARDRADGRAAVQAAVFRERSVDERAERRDAAQRDAQFAEVLGVARDAGPRREVERDQVQVRGERERRRQPRQFFEQEVARRGPRRGRCVARRAQEFAERALQRLQRGADGRARALRLGDGLFRQLRRERVAQALRRARGVGQGRRRRRDRRGAAARAALQIRQMQRREQVEVRLEIEEALRGAARRGERAERGEGVEAGPQARVGAGAQFGVKGLERREGVVDDGAQQRLIGAEEDGRQSVVQRPEAARGAPDAFDQRGGGRAARVVEGDDGRRRDVVLARAVRARARQFGERGRFERLAQPRVGRRVGLEDQPLRARPAPVDALGIGAPARFALHAVLVEHGDRRRQRQVALFAIDPRRTDVEHGGRDVGQPRLRVAAHVEADVRPLVAAVGDRRELVVVRDALLARGEVRDAAAFVLQTERGRREDLVEPGLLQPDPRREAEAVQVPERVVEEEKQRRRDEVEQRQPSEDRVAGGRDLARDRHGVVAVEMEQRVGERAGEPRAQPAHGPRSGAAQRIGIGEEDGLERRVFAGPPREPAGDAVPQERRRGAEQGAAHAARESERVARLPHLGGEGAGLLERQRLDEPTRGERVAADDAELLRREHVRRPRDELHLLAEEVARGTDEVRPVAQALRVADVVRRAEGLLVELAERRGVERAALRADARHGLAREEPAVGRGTGVVRAREIDAQSGGRAADDEAVEHEARHLAVAAAADELRAEGARRRVLQEVAERGQALQPLHEAVVFDAEGLQVRERRDEPEADRIAVRVQEDARVQRDRAAVDVAVLQQQLEARAFAGSDPEAPLDLVRVEREDLFDPLQEVRLRDAAGAGGLRLQPLARHQPARVALREEDEVGVDRAAVGQDAEYAVAFAEEGERRRLGQNLGAEQPRLGGQIVVENGPEHRVAVLEGGFRPDGGADGDAAVAERQPAFDDAALDRRGLQAPRPEDLGPHEVLAEIDGAGPVLRARIDRALDDDDGDPPLGEADSGGDARRPGADHDRTGVLRPHGASFRERARRAVRAPVSDGRKLRSRPPADIGARVGNGAHETAARLVPSLLPRPAPPAAFRIGSTASEEAFHGA